jgi:hypothetical protein
MWRHSHFSLTNLPPLRASRLLCFCCVIKPAATSLLRNLPSQKGPSSVRVTIAERRTEVVIVAHALVDNLTNLVSCILRVGAARCRAPWHQTVSELEGVQRCCVPERIHTQRICVAQTPNLESSAEPHILCDAIAG